MIDAAGRLLAGCQEPNTEHGFARLAELFATHRVAPRLPAPVPTLTTRSRIRQVLTMLEGDASVRVELTRRRLDRVLEIDVETRALKGRIAALVAASGTTLTTMYGIGPLVAARFLTDVVDIDRYPNRNAFAAAIGTAPLPAQGPEPSFPGHQERLRSPPCRTYTPPRGAGDS